MEGNTPCKWKPKESEARHTYIRQNKLQAKNGNKRQRLLDNDKGANTSNNMHECMLSHFSHVRLFATPQTEVHRLLCPWDSPGKNTRVACHFLLHKKT